MRMLMARIDLTIYPKKSKLGLALFERWETLRDLGGVYSSQWWIIGVTVNDLIVKKKSSKRIWLQILTFQAFSLIHMGELYQVGKNKTPEVDNNFWFKCFLGPNFSCRVKFFETQLLFLAYWTHTMCLYGFFKSKWTYKTFFKLSLNPFQSVLKSFFTWHYARLIIYHGV